MGFFEYLFGKSTAQEKSGVHERKDDSVRVNPSEHSDAVRQSEGSRWTFNPEILSLQVGQILPPDVVAAKEEAVLQKRMSNFEYSRKIYNKVRLAFPGDADTYKGLAKVEICRRDYHEAVYAIVMWMELIVYAIKHSDRFAVFKSLANKNIAQLYGAPSFEIKGLPVDLERIIRLIVESGMWSDSVLSFAVNKDPYLMLGLCYLRLFPKDLASCTVPPHMLSNYENALAGHPTGVDFRNTPYEGVVFALGLLMSMANVRGDVKELEKETLVRRWDRRPTYAVYTQTLEDFERRRDENMNRVLRHVVADVAMTYGCDVRPVHAIYLEKMVSDEKTYGNEIMALVGVTGSPLTNVPVSGTSYVTAFNRKLEDLRYVGDVYGMRIEIAVDDDDYVISSTGSAVEDQSVATWMSRRMNRNVHCGGTRREGEKHYRQYCWFEIHQF